MSTVPRDPEYKAELLIAPDVEKFIALVRPLGIFDLDTSETKPTVLGTGNFGRVWKAYHQFWKRPIAVKVLIGKVSNDSETGPDYSRSEALNWLDLSMHPTLGMHPHIIPLLWADVAEDSLLLFSDCVSGGSLQNWILGRGALPDGSLASFYSTDDHLNLCRVLDVGLKVVSALLHIHSTSDVLHGDLKPANILADFHDDSDYFQVYVCDFSISHWAAEQKSGTDFFAAPEQHADGLSKETTSLQRERIDVHGLAATLVVLCYGSNDTAGQRPLDWLASLRAGAGRLSLRDAGDFAALLASALSPDPGTRLGLEEFSKGLHTFWENLTGEKRSQVTLIKEIESSLCNNRGVTIANLGDEKRAAAEFARFSDGLNAYNQALLSFRYGELPASAVLKLASGNQERLLFEAFTRRCCEDGPPPVDPLMKNTTGDIVPVTFLHYDMAEPFLKEIEAEFGKEQWSSQTCALALSEDGEKLVARVRLDEKPGGHALGMGVWDMTKVPRFLGCLEKFDWTHRFNSRRDSVDGSQRRMWQRTDGLKFSPDNDILFLVEDNKLKAWQGLSDWEGDTDLSFTFDEAKGRTISSASDALKLTADGRWRISHDERSVYITDRDADVEIRRTPQLLPSAWLRSHPVLSWSIGDLIYWPLTYMMDASMTEIQFCRPITLPGGSNGIVLYCTHRSQRVWKKFRRVRVEATTCAIFRIVPGGSKLSLIRHCRFEGQQKLGALNTLPGGQIIGVLKDGNILFWDLASPGPASIVRGVASDGFFGGNVSTTYIEEEHCLVISTHAQGMQLWQLPRSKQGMPRLVKLPFQAQEMNTYASLQQRAATRQSILTECQHDSPESLRKLREMRKQRDYFAEDERLLYREEQIALRLGIARHPVRLILRHILPVFQPPTQLATGIHEENALPVVQPATQLSSHYVLSDHKAQLELVVGDIMGNVSIWNFPPDAAPVRKLLVKLDAPIGFLAVDEERILVGAQTDEEMTQFGQRTKGYFAAYDREGKDIWNTRIDCSFTRSHQQAAFHSKTGRLAVGTSGGLNLVDAITGKVTPWKNTGGLNFSNGLFWTSNGKLLVCEADGFQPFTLDLANGRSQRQVLKCGMSQAGSGQLCPDDAFISSYAMPSLYWSDVFDWRSGREEAILRFVHSVDEGNLAAPRVFSCHQGFFAGLGSYGIHIGDLRNPAPDENRPEHRKYLFTHRQEGGNCIEWSKDGRYITVAGHHSVEVYRVEWGYE